MTLAEETQEMAHEVASAAEAIAEDPKGAVKKAVGRWGYETYFAHWISQIWSEFHLMLMTDSLFVNQFLDYLNIGLD